MDLIGSILQDEDVGVDLRVHPHFFEFRLRPHAQITSFGLALYLLDSVNSSLSCLLLIHF